jgi:Helix-turn-helix domain
VAAVLSLEWKEWSYALSIKLMSAVWEREMSHPQQAILLALADHAHDDGTRIYPSYSRLAWKSGYSKRQVKRIVSDLIASGAILRKARGGPRKGTNSYRLDLSIFPLKPQFKWGHPDTTSDQKVVTPRHQGGDKKSKGGVIAMSPESPSESPLKPQSVPRANPTGSRPAEKKPEPPAQTFAERERDYLDLLRRRREESAQQKKVKQ